jgi:metal-responsive CopG/Arc/MetJ family transcriptional regulator
MLDENMPPSIPVEQKRRGRPATGQLPAIGVRLPAELIERVDDWATKNNSGLTRSEAVRRLLEFGLASAPKPKSRRARSIKVAKLNASNDV